MPDVVPERNRPSSAFAAKRNRRAPILNIRRCSLADSSAVNSESQSFVDEKQQQPLTFGAPVDQSARQANKLTIQIARSYPHLSGAAAIPLRAVQHKDLVAELLHTSKKLEKQILQNQLKSSNRNAGVQRQRRRMPSAWSGARSERTSALRINSMSLRDTGNGDSNGSSVLTMDSMELQALLAKHSAAETSLDQLAASEVLNEGTVMLDSFSDRWDEHLVRLYLKYRAFQGPELPPSWAPWFVSRRGGGTGYLGRMHQVIRNVLVIQKACRRWLALKYFLWHKTAAITIQKDTRAHQQRLAFARQRESQFRQDLAANHIQRMYRGRLARRWYLDLLQLREECLNAKPLESCLGAEMANTATVQSLTSPPSSARKPLTSHNIEQLRWLVETEGPYNWNKKGRQIDRPDWPGEELCRVHMSMLKEDLDAAALAAAKSSEATAKAAEEEKALAKAKEEAARKKAQQDLFRWTLLGIMPRDPGASFSVADVGETHNASVVYRLTSEQKAAAEEASILTALLQMIKPPTHRKGPASVRTLYGEAITSTEAAFQIFDRDNSGTVELAELRAGLRRLGLGLTDEQLNRLHATLDTDGDGTMSRDEFVLGLERVVEQKQRDQAAEKARREAAAAHAPGGRITEYVRPWTCPPEPMTMAQKLQRAVFKQMMAQRLTGILRGLKQNKDTVTHAVQQVLLSSPSDSNRCCAAVDAINASKGERHLLLLSVPPRTDEVQCSAANERYKLEACYFLPADAKDARWRRIFGRCVPYELPRSCAQLPGHGVSSEGLIYDSMFRRFSSVGDPQMSDDPTADDTATLDAVILRPRKRKKGKKGAPSTVATTMTDRSLLLDSRDTSTTSGRVMKLEHALRRAERHRRRKEREERRAKVAIARPRNLLN